MAQLKLVQTEKGLAAALPKSVLMEFGLSLGDTLLLTPEGPRTFRVSVQRRPEVEQGSDAET